MTRIRRRAGLHGVLLVIEDLLELELGPVPGGRSRVADREARVMTADRFAEVRGTRWDALDAWLWDGILADATETRASGVIARQQHPPTRTEWVGHHHRWCR